MSFFLNQLGNHATNCPRVPVSQATSVSLTCAIVCVRTTATFTTRHINPSHGIHWFLSFHSEKGVLHCFMCRDEGYKPHEHNNN